MSKNLLIVESPAKAKTIEKLLGADFVVKSSYGHISDLDKDKKAIDIANNYQPNYVVSPEKYKVVKELKDWVKKVDQVWLGTDEDREGEAISWHLAQVLGLDIKTTKRIVFREITKPALQKAVSQPRNIDLDLVDAQQARRILDRLVGFELSELLWRKIKGKLSAGRVQSVAVRLVAEREREIQEFQSNPFFKVDAIFEAPNAQGKKVNFKARLERKLEDQRSALAFLQQCLPAQYQVNSIEVKPAVRRPAPPFTTSTLQQEASRKLGYSVSRTMSVAQKLYEAGHISYMRTDSTNLSETAIQALSQTIVNNYGQQYLQTRQYKNKNASAQEAHEAIRPTYPDKQQIQGSAEEQKLYDLIWKRTLASQMADAQLERTVVQIGISTLPHDPLLAEGEVLKFDGFLTLYLESKDDEDEDENNQILPPLRKGQALDLKEMLATERFTRPQPRYTEASLVKKLEELGIGRPSTYAPTISKIMDPDRGYVTRESRPGTERLYRVLSMDASKIAKLGQEAIQQVTKKELVGAEKNKLFASDLGLIVTDFLKEHFSQIMDYSFTAKIEDKLDEVAEGKQNWVKVVDGVYKPFHQLIESTMNEAERVTGERILGKDPKSGRTILVRMSRFGPVVQIGTAEELGKEKPQYANLRPEHSLETMSLEEALTLFELPKQLGKYKDQEVSVGAGRYGPYVKWGETFISLPKGEDPLSVDSDRAIEVIEEKLRAEAPIGYYEGLPITKGSGRFGPFVKWKDLFVSIPKKSGYELATISEEQAISLIQEKQGKEAKRYLKNWEEQGIMIENGRWGPFIRMGKNFFKLIDAEGKKLSPEQVDALSLEEVQKMIEAQGGKLSTPKAKKGKK
jgi:DNA topoisomerase-1